VVAGEEMRFFHENNGIVMVCTVTIFASCRHTVQFITKVGERDSQREK